MNKPAIFISVLAIGTCGVAIWSWVALHRVEATIGTLENERGSLRSELDSTKQRLDAAHQRVLQAESQAVALKNDFSQIFSKKPIIAGPSAAPANKPSQGWSVGGFRRGRSFSFRSSAPVKGLDTTYQALYRQLQLSGQQIEQFKAIMAEAATRFEDVEREARKRSVNKQDRAIQALYTQTEAELRAKFIALFGADALPQMERFTETVFLRDALLEVAGELFYTEAPLTEPQANQLVDVLAKNMRDPAGRIDSAFADAGAMKSEAEPILSPPQLKVWREFIDHLVKTGFASLNTVRR